MASAGIGVPMTAGEKVSLAERLSTRIIKRKCAALVRRCDALEAREKVLREALKDLCRAYVQMLESARERILAYGGDCDPVDVMERADPRLAKARALVSPGEPQS